MSGKHNLVCEQGATFTFAFTVKTGDTAWNLINYDVTMTVRPFTGSATTTILASVDNEKIVLAAGGSVTVTLNAATTSAITPGKYVYDLVLDSGTVVTRLLEGKFVVTPSVA